MNYVNKGKNSFADVVNVAIDQKLSAGANEDLVINDLDFAVEDDELQSFVKMFDCMGVEMAYEMDGPSGWPVANFVAKTTEAKIALSQWMIENYFSDDLEYYKTIYPECFKYTE